MTSSMTQAYGNYSDKWFTPPEWLIWVQSCLGADYFDPCPQDYLEGMPSGLAIPWGDRWYCNHPGSRGGPGPWLEKAIAEWQSGGRGIWCAFSIEQVRHGITLGLLDVPGLKIVAPLKRMRYIWGGPSGTYGKRYRTQGEIQGSPGNWSVFLTNLASGEIAETPEPSSIIKATL